MIGLRLIGMKPFPDEIEGLFHFWKYVGYLLGIPIKYLPDTESEALIAIHSWMITQPAADEDSKALAHALMLKPLTAKFPEEEWRKERVVHIQLEYNKFFLGRDSCEAMGLPVKTWTFYPWMQWIATSMQESIIHLSSVLLEKSVGVNYRLQERIAYEFLKGHGRTPTVTKFQSDELFLSHNSMPWIVLICVFSIVVVVVAFVALHVYS
jgi:hypothetical protein